MSSNRSLFLGLGSLSICVCLLLPALAQFSYDQQGRRDPFIPLVTADGRFQRIEPQQGKDKTQILKVDGIVFDTMDLSYAIVNNDVVRVGDIVEGYQVLKIEPEKVTFIKEGQVSEVELTKKEGGV